MHNKQARNPLAELAVEALVRLQGPRERRPVRALSGKEDERVAAVDGGADGGEQTREEGVVGDEAGGREVARADADDLLALAVEAWESASERSGGDQRGR